MGNLGAHVVRAAIGLLIAGTLGLAGAPSASADPPYASCKAASADGRYNIPQADPAYRSKLDRDDDGIACEA
jgi:hypothetical protein